MSGVPIALGVGFSRCDEVISRSIRYFTRPVWWQVWRLADWSHMFLVFEFADGRREIHEALLSEGWSRKPFEKLTSWLEKKRTNHSVLLWFPGTPCDAVAAMHSISCAWIGEKRSYATRQIIDLAIRNTLVGRGIRALTPRAFHIRNDQRAMTCSEGASCILSVHPPLSIIRRHETWDMIDPQVAYDRLAEILDSRAEKKAPSAENLPPDAVDCAV